MRKTLSYIFADGINKRVEFHRRLETKAPFVPFFANGPGDP